MSIDVGGAVSFMAGHGRLLDRRRLAFLLDGDDPAGVLDALTAYRNSDGGYGWSLEPDLRAPESQPTAAMHAFEVLAEVAPAVAVADRAVELCEWLDRVTLADGGLPLALPVADPAACAPWWAGADATTSALQMTAQVAAKGHDVARHCAEVAGHPWLTKATRWCLDTIGRMEEAPHAYALLFAVQLLDAAAGSVEEADALLDRMPAHVPRDGAVPVAGGVEGETLHPLDFAPAPDRPVRRLFDADAVAADLGRLAGLQQDDGGWVVDFPASSPAAALEWRGYATVRAISVLRQNQVV